MVVYRDVGAVGRGSAARVRYEGIEDMVEYSKDEALGIVRGMGWDVVTCDWPHNVLAVQQEGEMGVQVFFYEGTPSVIRYDDLETEKSMALTLDGSGLEGIATPAQAKFSLNLMHRKH